MLASADVDHLIDRGLANLHHQEAHRMATTAPAPETYGDDAPPPAVQIARLQRALAAQSRASLALSDRVADLERRLAELETLKERLDALADSGVQIVPARKARRIA